MPEGPIRAALSRHQSQTSLSGAAPGGVLDSGLQTTALPQTASDPSVPSPMPKEAAESTVATDHNVLAPGAGLEKAQNFKWPWQSQSKPGGAKRQKQPDKNPGRAPATIPDHKPFTSSSRESDSASASQLPEGQLSSGGQPITATQKNSGSSFLAWPGIPRWNLPNAVDQASLTDQSSPNHHANSANQPGAVAGTPADAETLPDEAIGLADRAMSRIAAAQHALSASTSDSHKAAHSNSNHSSGPSMSPSGRAIGTLGLGLSPQKGNTADSPVSPKSGAFGAASSPQHNSRLRIGGANTEKLRQLVSEAKSSQQTPGHVSLLGQDSAAQRQGSEESHRSLSSAGQGRNDVPEGHQHTDNPGSQAAALDSAAGSLDDAQQARRYSLHFTASNLPGLVHKTTSIPSQQLVSRTIVNHLTHRSFNGALLWFCSHVNSCGHELDCLAARCHYCSRQTWL